MPVQLNVDQTQRAAICRITEGKVRWRVVVESWPEREIWRGRLLFEADGGEDPRESAAVLEGTTHEEVLARAHDLGEDHLKRLLHSL